MRIQPLSGNRAPARELYLIHVGDKSRAIGQNKMIASAAKSFR